MDLNSTSELWSNFTTTTGSGNGVGIISVIVLPICLIVGIFGNSLTIILLNTKPFEHLASRHFLISLAVADLFVIVTQPFKTMFVIRLIGFDIRALSSFGCQTYLFVHRSAKMASSWFVVCLGVERFTAVRFPFRVKEIFSTRSILISIASIVLTVGLFNIGYSYFAGVDDNGLCNSEVFNKNSTITVTIYQYTIGTAVVIAWVAPLGILLVITPYVIIILIQNNKKRAAMTQAQNQNMVVKPTIILMSVIIAYMIFVTPLGIVRILVSFTNGTSLASTGNTWFSALRDVAQILEIINYAINFVLYICTSKAFRQGIVDMLCGTVRKRNIMSSMSKATETTNF